MPTEESISALYCLLKLGHIVATITVNIQSQGFCTKDEEGDAEEGEGELQAGMGMAEGDIAEGAQNVGDEIDFEEQLRGTKDEQQVENDMEDGQDSKDFNMDADFDGQQKSVNEEEGEGKEDELDDQMGSADGEDYDLDQGQN